MNRQQAAAYIDHTVLKAAATCSEIEQLCAEAKANGFAAVCINPCYVPMAVERLQGTGVKVCTVIGFPLGANSSSVKAYEAACAVRDGALEVDMVINIGMVKDARYDLLEAEVSQVVRAAREENPQAVVKVIIETCLLTDEEKRLVCQSLRRTGADFVKTSTGFSTGGATCGDVALLRESVGNTMQVKASGGVRSLQDFQAMVAAGADRIGTSNGIAIVEQLA